MCLCCSNLTGFGKTYTGCTVLCHLLIKYPDTHAIILAPQKAVKAFKRELGEKLKVAYNTFISSKADIQKGARISIITHTSLKKYIPYINQLKEQGHRLLLLVDEAHCCSYDTLIQTNLGELKIGDIVTNQIKCKVVSYNESLNKIELKPIVQYFENECYEDMYEVSYMVKGKIKTVELTAGHPVYTKNRGYVCVEDLNENDIILSVSCHCDYCNEDLNKYTSSMYNKKSKSNTLCCSKACTLKLQHELGIRDNIMTDKVKNKISNKLKENYKTPGTGNYKRKQEMLFNNPMNNEIYRNKMISSIRDLASKGKLKNNFKYGNGKISEAEQFIYNDLINLGFEYNKGISTKSFKFKFPEAKVPFVYKADFINKNLKIAIEIDGRSHNYKTIKEADIKKQEVFDFNDYIVLRFTNKQVLTNKDYVLKEIKECIQKVK